MAAHKKTLEEFVRDRTFLARRHADLLATAPLVGDATLRALQAGYRCEPSELERRELARRFEHATRNTVRERELTMAQHLHAAIGPSASGTRLEKRWAAWDLRHGFSWRIAHDAAHQGDRLRAYQMLTGRWEPNLHRIAEEMPDLIQRARDELQLRPAPDPPGLRPA
jgi:hypothetical protein